MTSRRRLPMLVLAAIAAVAAVGHAVPANAAAPQKLFALDAEQGTLTPVAGRPGIQRLVLEDVRARALYFTDRPVREAGTVKVRPMLSALFAGDSPAPNAAINATATNRGQLLMGVELRAWRYDARERRLTLRVRHLGKDGQRTTFKRVHGDVVLPHSFHDVSVFIDDCCGQTAPVTIFNTSLLAITVQVNNGPQIEIPGAVAPSWLPGSPSTGVGFNASGPQPGALGPGQNELAVTAAGAIQPFAFSIVLPSSVNYNALQLYLFQSNYGFGGWSVLNDGQLIASGSSPR